MPRINPSSRIIVWQLLAEHKESRIDIWSSWHGLLWSRNLRSHKRFTFGNVWRDDIRTHDRPRSSDVKPRWQPWENLDSWDLQRCSRSFCHGAVRIHLRFFNSTWLGISRPVYEALHYTVADLEEVAGPVALFDDKVTLLMGRMRYPSLSLHGIEGAWSGSGGKTIIPSKVLGKFSIRLAFLKVFF